MSGSTLFTKSLHALKKGFGVSLVDSNNVPSLQWKFEFEFKIIYYNIINLDMKTHDKDSRAGLIYFSPQKQTGFGFISETAGLSKYT